ncbi:MAG: hypothetical protein HY291_13115 [Planctomycetes bacterium]|nr:hypothetical protein [Planctomycetota bacterium]
MKKTIAVLALSLAALSARAFDKTEAHGYLNSFIRHFDEVRLEDNESASELKWFLGAGKDCGEFMRDAFNNDKDKMHTRMAALFVLCKGWPELSERFLAKAEASEKPDLAEFGKRVRAYVARPPEKEVKAHFDNTQGFGFLKTIAKHFEDTNLGAIDGRSEVQWFIDQGEVDAYKFLRNALHNDKLSLAERQGALFILVKAWQIRAWDELKDAERSRETDMAQFAKRVRAFFDVPLVKPKKQQ